jgi:hypothetical protein
MMHNLQLLLNKTVLILHYNPIRITKLRRFEAIHIQSYPLDVNSAIIIIFIIIVFFVFLFFTLRDRRDQTGAMLPSTRILSSLGEYCRSSESRLWTLRTFLLSVCSRCKNCLSGTLIYKEGKLLLVSIFYASSCFFHLTNRPIRDEILFVTVFLI